MKERLGGKPPSAAKTWAVLGKRRLQEIRNLSPKGKERQTSGFFCVQPFPGEGEEGTSQRKVVRSTFPSAPAAARQAPWPDSHECKRSRAAEDSAAGGAGREQGARGLPVASGCGLCYCGKLRNFPGARAPPSPWLPGRPRAQTPRGARTGWGTHPGALPLLNNLQMCSPKLHPGPQGVAAASPRRASIPALQCSTAELRGPERPPLLPRGRPRLPLTSLVPEVAEGPGAGPGARPGGAGGRSSAGPPRASRPGAAARPPRPCARPSLALGSDSRGALLTPEGADARQAQGARGWRRAAAPLALLPPGQRGELELKPRPLLPQLPVPSRHAVAMARDGRGRKHGDNAACREM